MNYKSYLKLPFLALIYSHDEQKQFRTVMLMGGSTFLSPIMIWYVAQFFPWSVKSIFTAFGVLNEFPANGFYWLVNLFASLGGNVGLYIFSYLGFAYAVWMLVISTIGYKKRKNSLQAIIQMYAEALLCFSLMYFFLTFHNLPDDFHITGFIYLGSEPQLWISSVGDYFMNVFHAIHFSIMTMTIYSSGEYVAQSVISKIISDAQLLYSVLLSLVFVGRFFAEHYNKK